MITDVPTRIEEFEDGLLNPPGDYADLVLDPMDQTIATPLRHHWYAEMIRFDLDVWSGYSPESPWENDE